jgi:hypothetical protein
MWGGGGGLGEGEGDFGGGAAGGWAPLGRAAAPTARIGHGTRAGGGRLGRKGGSEQAAAGPPSRPKAGEGGELGREAATRLPSWLGHVQGKWVRKKGGSWATPRSRPREKGGLFYFPFFL